MWALLAWSSTEVLTSLGGPPRSTSTDEGWFLATAPGDTTKLPRTRQFLSWCCTLPPKTITFCVPCAQRAGRAWVQVGRHCAQALMCSLRLHLGDHALRALWPEPAQHAPARACASRKADTSHGCPAWTPAHRDSRHLVDEDVGYDALVALLRRKHNAVPAVRQPPELDVRPAHAALRGRQRAEQWVCASTSARNGVDAICFPPRQSCASSGARGVPTLAPGSVQCHAHAPPEF